MLLCVSVMFPRDSIHSFIHLLYWVYNHCCIIYMIGVGVGVGVCQDIVCLVLSWTLPKQ